MGSLAQIRENPRILEAPLRYTILALTCAAAILFRLYPVVRHETMLHEYEPYFNYRATKVLVEQGPYGLLNWFDTLSWYPFGRTSTGVHWGLVGSAASAHWLLSSLLHIPVEVQTVCIFLGPCISCVSVLAAYKLGKEICGASSGAGLLSAALVAMLPGCVARTTAGAFHPEAVALPAMLLSSLLFLRACGCGSGLGAAGSAAVWALLCAPWPGAAFLLNLFALFLLALLLLRRYSGRTWAAYSTFCLLAALLSLLRLPAPPAPSLLLSLDLALPSLLFLLLQAHAAASLLSSSAPALSSRLSSLLSPPVVFVLSLASLTGLLLLVSLLASSPASRALLAVLDPASARTHAPLHASVSEHQPSTWAASFFDLHITLLLIPAGLSASLHALSDPHLFLLLFLLTSLAGAGLMVRGMGVLGPAAALTAALPLHSFLATFTPQIKTGRGAGGKGGKGKEGAKGEGSERREVAVVLVLGVGLLLALLVQHSAWVSAHAHSAPGLVLHAKQSDGRREELDDFREAFAWIRAHTPSDAKVLGWLDYGYHISALGNRTSLADLSALNSSHVAALALALASPEPLAARMMGRLGAEYVMVVFGGLAAFEGDDLNKLLWMLRVAAHEFNGKDQVGGERAWIKEQDYLGGDGELRVDGEAAAALQASLLYRLSFHRFGALVSEYGRPPGFDRVRRAEIGLKDIQLTHFEEVFTSERWLARVYKLRPPENRR